MTLKNLTHEELTRHLEQARLIQQQAIVKNRQDEYREAEELEERIINERMRRQQEREEPDTEGITL